jgi:hypothetical protein
MDDSDSDDDEPTPAPRSPPPIAAPRPGYVTKPIDLARPEAVAVPTGRSRPAELTRTPSTEPHPLRAPMTPIQPVFARPAKPADPTVQFAAPIMRGVSEDVLIPSRGQKGDDFWRRFSIIAHDDAAKKPGEKERLVPFCFVSDPCAHAVCSAHGSPRHREGTLVCPAGCGAPA